MKNIILEFPKQFKTGIESAKNTLVKGNFENLIICGLGGSALPGDLLKFFYDELELKIPVVVHRDYGLPSFAKEKSLLVCISYSGNTEETISAFKSALEKKISLAAISSGGKLEELARENNIPFCLIPNGLQPRMALGIQFSALVKILQNAKMVKETMEKELLSLEDKIKPEDLEKEGQEIASRLKGKIPIIYSSSQNKFLSRIWKIKFNENCKIPSFSNYFPELNHNEMVGFTKIPGMEKALENFSLLILRDESDHERNLKRMDLTARIAEKKNINSHFIEIRGGEKFLKAFRNILLSDWTSYYLALESNVDPIPVDLVESFKRDMG